MTWGKAVKVGTVIFLLLISMVLLPSMNALGQEYKAVPVQKDDHFSLEIEKPSRSDDGTWRYEISCEEVQGYTFDCYILCDDEYEKYSSGGDFQASLSMENISSTGVFRLPVSQVDPIHYLVIDNRDNAHDDDAGAERNISVDISVERKEDNKGSFSLSIMVFFVGCGVPLVLLVGILIWMKLEFWGMPQANSEKYRKMKRDPAFQPTAVNPEIRFPEPYPSPPSVKPGGKEKGNMECESEE